MRCAAETSAPRCGCAHFGDLGLLDYYVDVHQQYLAKNPYGYRCHANTGVKFPEAT